MNSMNWSSLIIGLLLAYIGLGLAVSEILIIRIRMCIYNDKQYNYSRLDTFLMYSFYPVIIVRDTITVLIYGR